MRQAPRQLTPLYYCVSRDLVEIGDDLHQLALDVCGCPEPDLGSLLHFCWRGRPRPGHTLYDGIWSFGIGEELVCSQGCRPVIRRYWWPLFNEQLPTDEAALRTEVVTRLESAVVQGITRRGTTQAKTAILLSGGIDSGLIAALARRCGFAVTGFTATFDDARELGEEAFAQRVAQWLEIPHRVVRLGATDAKRLLEAVLSTTYPRAAPAAITHHALVNAVVEQEHSCLLTGLGADECFGGYDKTLRHLAAQLHQSRRRGTDLSGLLNFPLHRLQRMREALFLGVAEFFTLSELSEMAADRGILSEFAAADLAFYRGALIVKPEANPIELMAAHEYQYRLSEMLLPAFRTDMRTLCLEFPFLDRSVYQWASALDPGQCYWYEREAWWAKRLLRAAAAELLPNDIVMRRRQVLLAPIGHWLLARPFREAIIEELANSTFWTLGVLQRATRNKLLSRLRGYGNVVAGSDWQEKMWVLLSLCAWVNRSGRF